MEVSGNDKAGIGFGDEVAQSAKSVYVGGMNSQNMPITSNPGTGLVSVWLVLVLVCCGHGRLLAQTQLEERVAIATEVVCRDEPDRSSSVVMGLDLGHPFAVQDSRMDSSGDAVWYATDLGFHGLCWIFGPLTVPFDSYRNPDPTLLAIAEHALQLGGDASFEHLVAVDNLLVERSRRLARYFRAPEEIPPILQLRHMEVVNRAARTLGFSQATRGNPLRMAWVLSHSAVRYFEPGGAYHVPGERFWQLYEQHAASTDAELIAWTAAEAPVFSDECYAACILSVLASTYMRYWEAFPRGNHLVAAVTIGTTRAEYAAQFCVLVSTGYLGLDRDRIGTLVNEFRISLQDVSVPEKDALLEHLFEIDQTCVAGKVENLQDPAAIPGLAKALPLGFSIVRRRLASFGEEAASAVLERAQSTENETARAALVTLRFMVEGAETRPLSAFTLGQIRRTAGQWLTKSSQSILTLSAAIDLAAVLVDPELTRILKSLVADPNEVMARGIESPVSIERMQQRASDGLAGTRPLPRP